MSQTNDTEQILELPSWLNHKYLEKVLQDFEKDKSIQLSSYDMSPAVAKGNNFASIILRCRLKYIQNAQNMEKAVIIKAALINDLLDQFDSQNVEMAAYGRIFPRIHELLQSIGDETQLVPKTLVIDKEHKTLIFEDLKDLNYCMGDRKIGLDMDHIKLVLNAHAKLHACSLVIKERYNENFDEFRRGLYFEDANLWLEFVRNMFSAASEVISQWKGYEKYGTKLKNMVSFVAEQACRIIKERNETTSVFCHGDCWTANLMFKYEDDHPKDVMLIDFQEPIYGSPAFDLFYLIMTSAQDNIKFNSFDEIVQHYHGLFGDYLKKLNYKGKTQTLFELQNECLAKSLYGLVTTIVVFTIMMNDGAGGTDLDSFMGDSDIAKEARNKMFQNERLQKTLMHFLPIWDSHGLLDELV